MPTAGGLGKAIRSGKAIGCDAVQVFTSSPQQWKAKEITDAMVADFQAALTETGIEVVVSHDSYLINLASENEESREKSILGLSGELGRCAKYGIPFVVSHIGARSTQTEEQAISRASEGILRVLDLAPVGPMLLMETTAGQGSALNANFEQIAEILRRVAQPERVGVCLDTCHIFAAGYDLRTPEAFRATFEAFDQIVGFNRLKAVHCNDSKKGLGSRVDRHAHIGEGEIGLEGFRLLVNDPRFAQIPILLETPEAETCHEKNLATLRSLVA